MSGTRLFAFFCYTDSMLIMGHRGARSLHPENTLASLRAGFDLGVDIIEFDVRLTKDKVPILLHDRSLLRTHKKLDFIHRSTFKSIEKRMSGRNNPIARLEDVLDEFGGRTLLNLELKDRGTAAEIMPIIQNYIKRKRDWETFLFSSFKASELRVIRKFSEHAQLGLLERLNPLRFLSIDNELRLDAVGFHRLHVNSFTVSLAKERDLFVYVHTVNRPIAAERLRSIGVDGIVTDVPDIMIDYFSPQKIA